MTQKALVDEHGNAGDDAREGSRGSIHVTCPEVPAAQLEIVCLEASGPTVKQKTCNKNDMQFCFFLQISKKTHAQKKTHSTLGS